MVFAFAAPVFAKGGGGGARGGGFSSSSRSFSSSKSSFSNSKSSVSSSKQTYSKGYSSTKAPKDMTGFRTYRNSSGKTVYYVPKTYSSSPRVYRDSPYSDPYRYHYVNNTSSDFWFWMWLMGRNSDGMSAPQKAVDTTGTNDAGQPEGKAKAVKVSEESAWDTYSTGDKIFVAFIWILLLLSGVSVIWLIVAAVRYFAGYQYRFRFWKRDDRRRGW
jgi:hypothetical protein